MADTFESGILGVIWRGTELETCIISGTKYMRKEVGRASSQALPCGRIGIITTSASHLAISRDTVSKGAGGALLDTQFGSSIGIEWIWAGRI